MVDWIINSKCIDRVKIKEEEMVGSKAVAELQKTITDVINAYLESESMSICELIGVLEMAKLDVYYSGMIDEEDDD